MLLIRLRQGTPVLSPLVVLPGICLTLNRVISIRHSEGLVVSITKSFKKAVPFPPSHTLSSSSKAFPSNASALIPLLPDPLGLGDEADVVLDGRDDSQELLALLRDGEIRGLSRQGDEVQGPKVVEEEEALGHEVGPVGVRGRQVPQVETHPHVDCPVHRHPDVTEKREQKQGRDLRMQQEVAVGRGRPEGPPAQQQPEPGKVGVLPVSIQGQEGPEEEELVDEEEDNSCRGISAEALDGGETARGSHGEGDEVSDGGEEDGDTGSPEGRNHTLPHARLSWEFLSCAVIRLDEYVGVVDPEPQQEESDKRHDGVEANAAVSHEAERAPDGQGDGAAGAEGEAALGRDPVQERVHDAEGEETHGGEGDDEQVGVTAGAS
eukprot:767470-Hanusia_phi.AAC.5